MRRVALSRLHIAAACPGSHRDDCEWVKTPSTWSQKSGLAFHDAIEFGKADGLAVKFGLSARQVELLNNQVDAWKKWEARSNPGQWTPEIAIAYHPITGEARELTGKEKDDRITLPNEWYGRVDAVGEQQWFADWKSGRQRVAPPKANPQMWGLAPMVALLKGWNTIDGLIVQVDEQDADESRQTFTNTDLVESMARMAAIHRSLVPDAPYIPGPHCGWCPAKTTCAVRKAQETMPKKEEAMPEKTNVRPITSARMSLKNVVKGSTDQPARVLIHGADKVGKSSFAAGAPSPIFIGLEGGLDELGPARFPEPKSFDDVLAAIEELKASSHSFKTLVIDPVNWLEPLIFIKVCEEYGKTNIDDVLGGFHKGQDRAVKYWDQLIAGMESLRAEKKMNVVLTAHTMVRNYKNPEGQDWGSWQPAMDKGGSERLKQWADVILFARLEEFAKLQDGKVKGKSTGARVIFTRNNAAYAAGNRYNLPESLPLSWAELWRAIGHGRKSADELSNRMLALAKEFGEDTVEKVSAYLAEAGDDIGKITEGLNALIVKKETGT